MNRLKELRLQNGYKTQSELAKVLFVNQTAVSQWERGITLPSSQMILKLSELYGESVDYILGRTDQREEKQPAPMIEGGLSEELLEVIRRYDAAPPVLRAAALAVLRSAEEPHKVQGDGTGEK